MAVSFIDGGNPEKTTDLPQERNLKLSQHFSLSKPSQFFEFRKTNQI
jgi:hypothetical protein